jgi:hypothetical protein
MPLEDSEVFEKGGRTAEKRFFPLQGDVTVWKRAMGEMESHEIRVKLIMYRIEIEIESKRE